MADCIETTATHRDKDGYGILWYQGKTHRAHRVAFFEAHGYWPNICRHACDNPPCVNPLHLLDGTATDNNRDTVARGHNVNAAKTHCSKGHEYSPENTAVYVYGANTFRHCRICDRARAIVRQQKIKARV